MNYPAQIETRPLSPFVISNGENPRCEIIVPLPASWRKFISGWRIDIEETIAIVVCNPWLWVDGKKAVPCRDFLELWRKGLGDFARPIHGKGRVNGRVNASFPIRIDVLDCLQSAAESVKQNPHEVLAKILTRTLPLMAERPLPKVRLEQEQAMNIIPFPSDLVRR